MIRSGQLGELILFRADLDLDGSAEYVLAAEFFDDLIASGFRLEDGVWREYMLLPSPAETVPEPGQTLTDGAIEVVAPEFYDLRIGEITLQVDDP